MAVDLAIDFKSGDLVVAPNKDIALRDGKALIDQRIRIRLKVIAGEWALDPTGSLGSHLQDSLRTPVWRSVTEVPLIVREALAPMEDINVVSVIAEPTEDDSSGVSVTINYTIFDPDVSGEDTEANVLSTTVDVG